MWDDAELQRAGWSLKGIGFIYECRLDLPVTIRGDPVSEVCRFAQELRCAGIATMASPDPRIQAQAAAMGAEILPLDPFVELKGKVDLARFSRYWRKAEVALRGEEPSEACADQAWTADQRPPSTNECL